MMSSWFRGYIKEKVYEMSSVQLENITENVNHQLDYYQVSLQNLLWSHILRHLCIPINQMQSMSGILQDISNMQLTMMDILIIALFIKREIKANYWSCISE